MVEETTEFKITSVEKNPKVKDPKRVAAGQRLGAISKMAKENKMRERIQAKQVQNYQSSDDVLTIIVGGGAAVIGGYFLYKHYNDNKEKIVTPPNSPEKPKKKKIPSSLD